MKELSFKNSTTGLTMSASDKLSRIVDRLYSGQSTSSIKSSMRIVGLKGDSTAAFIKSILDNAMSGLSGSFSFKFRTDVGVGREKDLIAIAEAMHKETDFALSEAYSLLSEDDKKIGQVIAEQNAIRNVLLELCSTMSDARAVVDNWLTVNNKLIIPNGAQLESTIIGGNRMYRQPRNLVGYKKKVDETQPGQPDIWTKVSEIYGRKRVPLKGDESITKAFELLAAFAKSWEDYWSDKDPQTDDEIIDGVLEWTKTLTHKDHVIVVNKLSDTDLIRCKKTAEQYYREMNSRRS